MLLSFTNPIILVIISFFLYIIIKSYLFLLQIFSPTYPSFFLFFTP